MAYYAQHSFCASAEGFSTLPENYRNNSNYAVYNLNPNAFVCGWNVYEPADATTTVSSRKSYSVEEILSRNSEVWNFYTSGRFDVNETVGNNFDRKIVLREKPKPCERVNWKVKNYKITLYHEQKQVRNNDHLLLVSQWGCGSVLPNSQAVHIPIQAQANTQAQSFSGSYSGSYARSNSSSVYRSVGTPTTEVVDVEINTNECVKVPSPVPVPVPVPIPRPITPPKPCNVCNENVSNDEYRRYYDSLNKGSSINYSNNNTSNSYNVSSTSNNNASVYDYNSAYNSVGNNVASYNNNSTNYYDTSSYNYDSASYNYDDQSYIYDEVSYDDQYDYDEQNYSDSSARRY